MTTDVLDLDDIAADDALIESIRSGAVRDDLPDGDPAVDVLLAVRDGAQAPVDEPSVAVRRRRAIASRVISHRRAIAVSVVAGVAVTTGVGAAVAGDPTAAFKYVFDRGVEIGSRFGTPGGNSSAAGDFAERPHVVGVSSPPVRQGSAAGPLGDTREDTSVGFVRDPDYWVVPTPRGLEEYSDGDSDSSGKDGIATAGDVATTEAGSGEGGSGDGGTGDSPETEDPVVTTGPTADENGPEEGPETDGSDPSDGPTTLIVPPTDTPTDLPTETTTPPPTETTSPPPTETPSPTETTPPPTQTTPSPTETTSPPPSTTAPTTSEPTTQ